jgi:ActR/RegA family two-component response regulator
MLIVDAEPNVTEILADLFSDRPYSVDTASNGEDAIERLRVSAYDVMLTESTLPDVSGLEVISAAMNADPEMVAVVVTAYVSTGTAIDALRRGAYDYLTKPFDLWEVEQVVTHGLQTRQLRKENRRLARLLAQNGVDIVGKQDNVTEGPSVPIRQSCFISYSTKDKAFVDRLRRELNSRGVDYWYAPEHGRWGGKLTSQITQEIVRRDRVLLVCSEASLNDSDWVRWEIEKAFAEEERRGREVVFPLTIDDAVFKWNHPLATKIRETLVGDFRDTTDGAAFLKGINRLLEGLRSNATL